MTREQQAKSNLQDALNMPTSETYPERQSLETRAVVYALLAVADELSTLVAFLDENAARFGGKK